MPLNTMNASTASPRARISLPFFLAMGILTLAVFIFVTLPVDLAALVCIVRGPAAYFHDGIRIVGSRPARFTDGGLVPAGLSAVVGLLSALLTMWIVGGSLLAIRNRAKRHFENRKDDVA